MNRDKHTKRNYEYIALYGLFLLVGILCLYNLTTKGYILGPWGHGTLYGTEAKVATFIMITFSVTGMIYCVLSNRYKK